MAQMIETSHCRISVTEAAGDGPAVLFIHGNSSCKEVFQDQLNSDLGRLYRCFAMDLPGHGQSEDARNPKTTYTMTGYADAALQVMNALHQGPFAVVGWSLGGHIGIEMLAHSDNIQALLISGTPPIGRDPADMGQAFLPNEHMAATGQEHLTEAEADAYAHTTCGEKRYEAFLGEAVQRTDGRARRIMMAAAMAGTGINQREMVESTKVPLAVINGSEEPLVNNDYVMSLNYSSLWHNKVHLIEQGGHAPFWDEPEQFNSLLTDFLASAL